MKLTYPTKNRATQIEKEAYLCRKKVGGEEGDESEAER